jgi:hypothetical protein
LVESPFILTNNLKKSFIKDSKGNLRTSGFIKQHYYKQNGYHDNLKHVMDENNSLKKFLAKMKQEKDEVMEILDAKEEKKNSLKKALSIIEHEKDEVMKVLDA